MEDLEFERLGPAEFLPGVCAGVGVGGVDGRHGDKALNVVEFDLEITEGEHGLPLLPLLLLGVNAEEVLGLG